ncbi:MAG: SRPBCC family protein [Chloroflexi bacterium]|nr:SRPBCC family protein [Chloroflexota bacterium]
MKYTCKLVINVAREPMVKLFDDPDNMLKWMEGLQSFEHVSGTPGEPGATSRLTFARDNGTTFDMIETLTRYNLPDEISGTYETEGVRNVIENWFVEDGPNATQWIAHNVFEFGGVMRVAAWFMRPLFKRQSLKIMESFKVFAESTALAGEDTSDGDE